ncbi:hypothetical protein [uncultured Arthrobacter sp.]|uniref:hypothetical protein n=1 Tax=uncultured Arthrobacter sp. TaxID=114050 RepID=UPI00260B059C|nr:hypothetical protein [uncultured Arthrobacter sp.]
MTPPAHRVGTPLQSVPPPATLERVEDQREEQDAGRSDRERRRALAVHPSAGRQKLRILVQIDAESGCIRIVVRGCLTPLNVHGLDLVVSRASTLGRESCIIVDLAQASQWEGMDSWLQTEAIERRLNQVSRNAMGDRLRIVPMTGPRGTPASPPIGPRPTKGAP